uniref:Chloroplast envelope membrane protein n=1 Tax=Lobelia heterophylla subsp. heterophylla TaxID=2041129 RepID=A0A291EY87_9ASTR|nr:chloroplast envelope membrane protein [Lobelia heterophylla subsp. heterophylla]
MAKKKTFTPLLYLASIVFLPRSIAILFKKSLESWISNWWNTGQSETFLNAIEEKSILEKFRELEDLLLVDEMLKEDSKTHLQNLLHTETIQLIKIQNEDRIHMILDLLTNLISFVGLIGYSILGNKELVILNSWAKEFLYNLSDTTKALSLIFFADFCFGFHSVRGWELIITKYLGFVHNDLILAWLLAIIPAILNSMFNYWVFYYLTRISPSLVVIFHAMDESF